MIYFDNGATSRYKPKTVIRAMKKAVENSANGGRGGHDDAIRVAMQLHETRNGVKAFVGGEKYSEVVFTKSCTEAINLVLFGIRRKGHVITTYYEHNSVLRVLKQLEDKGEIEVTYVIPNADGKITTKEVLRHIRQETFMLIVNHMSNVTGECQNIKELAEITNKKGILLFVDGAQSLGHLSIDMDKTGIDFLAGAGHKGLHAAQGVGFLAYNKRITLSPLIYGGTGTDSLNLRQAYNPPDSLEAGTLAAPNIVALYEGIKWTERNFDIINKKIKELSSYILEELAKNKKTVVYTKENNGVIAFNLFGKKSEDVADALSEKYGIAVRGGYQCAPLIHQYLKTEKCGVVRATVGYNNSFYDAKKLIEAVYELAR